MEKGFVFYKDKRVPFVIENYRLELFTDDDVLRDFIKEHNHKSNYILKGQCFYDSTLGENATFLIKESVGSTCFLLCYTVCMSRVQEKYNSIRLQSPFLDNAFKYQYNYLDMARQGVNLSMEPQEVYRIPFSMDKRNYELSFRIGYDNRQGLLEDYHKNGEIIIPLCTNEIQECYNISVVLYRLAKFMTSCINTPFKKISLYQDESLVGWFYCPFVSKDIESMSDTFFYDFDVMKYIPRILNNIALDSGNKITKSIPLGHLSDFESLFLPQRFIEQIMAFEYLFDKLEPQKAQDKKYYLVCELEDTFKWFPELLSGTNMSINAVSNDIKELRRTITHGYEYYYDFGNDSHIKYYMTLLDRLIRKMSLKWIGFSEDEIKSYNLYL